MDIDEATTAELYLRDIQHAAGMVLAELAMDTSVPTVSWGVHSLYRDDEMFPTLEGQAKSLAEVEAYAALWDVPVTDRFAATKFEGTTFQVVAVLRGIHVRVWAKAERGGEAER